MLGLNNFKFSSYINTKLLIISICLIGSCLFIINVDLQTKDTSVIAKTPNPIRFNVDKNVLVFLHIQKTSGREFDFFLTLYLTYTGKDKTCRMFYDPDHTQKKTTEYMILNNLSIPDASFGFKCYNASNQKPLPSPIWYWGRGTVRWPCGTHSHFATLKPCISKYYPYVNPEKGFIYFTMLRDPVKRYISEWKHGRRDGEVWTGPSQRNTCLFINYRKCFKNNKNWIGSSLSEFIDCKYNLAINRQATLLSDSNYDCVNKSDDQLLSEAKRNLESIPFFGLTEYNDLSQKLFLKTFEGSFKISKQFKMPRPSIAENYLDKLPEENVENLIEKIKKINSVDIKFYEFAKDLFIKRLTAYNIF